MDLADLDLSGAATLQLRHPATGAILTGDDGAPVTIALYGVDSGAYTEYRRALANKAVRRGTKTQMTAEEYEDEALGLLAACTADWTGLELDGKPLPFTMSNAKMIYRRFAWLRDQVDTFIADRANFSKASSAI